MQLEYKEKINLAWWMIKNQHVYQDVSLYIYHKYLEHCHTREILTRL